MTLEIAAILGLLILAVYLFATEKLPVDIITLLALCILSGARILTPAEAFAGFSNEILIMLGAIFVLGGALQNNGVPNLLAAKLMKLTGSHPRRLLAGLMLASASASAFMNNTTVAALFVPPTTGLARKTGVSASKLLMPLAFSAILGGTCTLIGTSTNIAVSGYLKQAGYQSLGMFEVLPMGLIMVALGIGYMVFAGWKMLPEHETDTLSEPEEMRNYLAEVLVLPGSPLAGTKAIKPGLSNFRIVAIQNGGSQVIPDSRSVIKEGDRLIVNGVVDELRKITKTEGLRFCSKLDLEDLETDTPGSETEIVEAIILPGGELVGTCLSEIRFKQRYGLTVLAIHRNGESQMENLAEGIIKT
jgi:di/tricarboxylate transporter